MVRWNETMRWIHTFVVSGSRLGLGLCSRGGLGLGGGWFGSRLDFFGGLCSFGGGDLCCLGGSGLGGSGGLGFGGRLGDLGLGVGDGLGRLCLFGCFFGSFFGSGSSLAGRDARGSSA